MELVADELRAARVKYRAMHSGHEGLAVILEEVDELKREVFTNGGSERMMREAVQVAAMAMRFIEDVCNRFPVPAGEQAQLEDGGAHVLDPRVHGGAV